jgi:hypothetical protein
MARKLPQLCGFGEAAELLGLPGSSIPPLRKRDPRFPATIHEQQGLPELRCGPIWFYDDIAAYAADRAKRLGK